MRLYVPDIGSSLRLEQDWKFPVYDERRNDSLLKVMAPDWLAQRRERNWARQFNTSIWCVLPAGTELIVARVYIRNGMNDYSSLTFRIGECPHKPYSKKRFWVKLADANRIEYVI